MIGWESTNILPQCECTQLGASQVQLWVAARGHGNLWICLWFASQADPSLIYEDINLLQSCQVGVRTSYSQVAPYNCSCWAFERRMAWILPRVLVWRLEETFQPHLALCSCVLKWTEWLPALQVDRGKNDLLKPVLEQTSVSYFPAWIVFDSPHCCSWRAGPANTLNALFQPCRSCFATERESSAGRGYSQRWQSPECPSLNPDGGSNFVQSSLLWHFAALEQGLNKEPWKWNMRAAFLQRGYSVTDTPCD